MQGCPSILGEGAVQDLSRTLLPLPHDDEQLDHEAHSLKPPSTKQQRNKWYEYDVQMSNRGKHSAKFRKLDA